MAKQRAARTTKTVKRKRRVKVGGSRKWDNFALWQKVALLVLFAGLVSVISIFAYTKFMERDLLAKAATYQKIDIKSKPTSNAGVTFHACKAVSGDVIKVTVLATKPKNVIYARADTLVYRKAGTTQVYNRTATAKTWWGGEVSAVQVRLSRAAGEELLFTAQSRSGRSAPRYTTQPVRKDFKSDTSYQAALREFQAATIDPMSFVDCGSAASAINSSLCLRRSGEKLAVSNLQKARYTNYAIKPNTVIDGRRAYWDGTDAAGLPISWAITVDGIGPACWYGGKYTGAWDDQSRSVTWSKDYHHAGAFTIRMNDFLVEGLRAHNQGDGIRMEAGGSNFHIKEVYLSDIHDDCVENDYLHSGIVENSLFDGCYAGISAATHDGINPSGPKNVWTFRNNLLRMKAFPTMFRPEKYGSFGHAMLFKGWYAPNKGPQLVLENNIFLADRKSSIGDLQIPPNAVLKGCSNNTFVWLGEGPFPYKLPSCFRVTTDKSVWDNAVAQWRATYTSTR